MVRLKAWPFYYALKAEACSLMLAHARGKPLAFASSLAKARSRQEQRVRNVKGCAASAYARIETQSKDSLNGFGRFYLRGFVVF